MLLGNFELLHESALILAAVSMALALYVLAKGVGNLLNISFAALGGLISLWAFSFFVAQLLKLRAFETVHLNATLLLGPVSLVFMDLLLKPEGLIFRGLKYLAYFVLVCFFPLITFGMDRYPAIRDITYYSPVAIIFACGYLLLSETFGGVFPRGNFNVLLRREEVLSALKKRNFWIYAGGIGVTLLCVMNRVSWLGTVVPAIGNFCLAMYLYFLKDVVLEYKLVNLRRVLAGILSDLLAAGFVFCSVMLLTIWVQDSIPLLILNTFLAAFVAVSVLSPFRRLSTLFFDKFLFQETAIINQLSLDYGKKLAGAFSEIAVANTIEDLLKEVMGASIQAFYTLDNDQKQFKLVRGGKIERLPLSFSLITHWEKNRDSRPLVLSDLKKQQEQMTFLSKGKSIDSLIAGLMDLECAAAIPFIKGRKVLGFVTLGSQPEFDGESEFWEKLVLLRPFFQRATDALAELEIFASLRERDRLATMGEMASGLAHEIRNPLGAIKGAVQVLDPKPADKDYPFLKIIIEEVDRLNKVVTQFLDYSRPLKPEMKSIELASLVQGCVERFKREKIENINFNFQNNLGNLKVTCAPELIDQVLQNFIQNAVHAVLAKKNSQAQSIEILLKIDISRGQEDVVVCVTDCGIGISPEDLDKLFIPFFTLSSKGTGLGLSICQRIAEIHGGRIEFDSIIDRGTTVCLRIPVNRG